MNIEGRFDFNGSKSVEDVLKIYTELLSKINARTGKNRISNVSKFIDHDLNITAIFLFLLLAKHFQGYIRLRGIRI